MMEIRQTEVYARWFNSLRDRQARARIDVRIRRLSLGNLGDVKPVGEGVSELRIDYNLFQNPSWYANMLSTDEFRKPRF